MTTTLPGKHLARELEEESRSQAFATSTDPVIEATASRAHTKDQYFRLNGQLYTLERTY